MSDTIGDIFRRGDYYMTKRIREIVGKQRSTNEAPQAAYAVTLYDSSETKITYFTPDDAGVYGAILSSGDGDVITLPPGTYTDGLPLSDNGNYPEVAVIGQSRINTALTSGQVDMNGGSSLENMSIVKTSSSASSPSCLTHWQGGTVTLVNVELTMDNNGSGNAQGIYIEDSTGVSIMNIWNSTITGDASTGDGYAIWADESTVNCYNCYLRATHTDIIKTTNGGTINLFGCRLEEI